MFEATGSSLAGLSQCPRCFQDGVPPLYGDSISHHMLSPLSFWLVFLQTSKSKKKKAFPLSQCASARVGVWLKGIFDRSFSSVHAMQIFPHSSVQCWFGSGRLSLEIKRNVFLLNTQICKALAGFRLSLFQFVSNDFFSLSDHIPFLKQTVSSLSLKRMIFNGMKWASGANNSPFCGPCGTVVISRDCMRRDKISVRWEQEGSVTTRRWQREKAGWISGVLRHNSTGEERWSQMESKPLLVLQVENYFFVLIFCRPQQK